jgi:hypothetical protein
MSRANPRFRRNQIPMPPPAHNLYAVKVIGTVQGQLLIHTLYYLDEQLPGVGADTASLAAQINATVIPFLQAAMATDVIYNKILVGVMNIPDSPTLDMEITPVAGALAGNSRGTETAATLYRYTAIKSKCGRGDMNIPVWAQAPNVVGSQLSGAGVVLYALLASNLFSVVLLGGGHTYTPALASRGTRLAPKILGSLPIALHGVRLTLGTVRRRKIGRGP